MFDAKCDFCLIARGRSPAEVVIEYDAWLAFFPVNPATPGHTLVVPRDHIPDLWAASRELAGELMQGVVEVGTAIQDVLKPDGLNLITSAGTIAEQTVFHLHLHVVPRWRADHFGQIWPVGERYDVEDLGDVASNLRTQLVRQRMRGSDG